MPLVAIPEHQLPLDRPVVLWCGPERLLLWIGNHLPRRCPRHFHARSWHNGAPIPVAPVIVPNSCTTRALSRSRLLSELNAWEAHLGQLLHRAGRSASSSSRARSCATPWPLVAPACSCSAGGTGAVALVHETWELLGDGRGRLAVHSAARRYHSHDLGQPEPPLRCLCGAGPPPGVGTLLQLGLRTAMAKGREWRATCLLMGILVSFWVGFPVTFPVCLHVQL